MKEHQTEEKAHLDGPASVWPRDAVMQFGLAHLLESVCPNWHILTVEVPTGLYLDKRSNGPSS